MDAGSSPLPHQTTATQPVSTSQQQQDEPIINMLAGGISGVLSKTATAPLARLTILYQVQSFIPHQPHPQCPTTAALPQNPPLRTPILPSPSSPSQPSQPTNNSRLDLTRTHPRATANPYLWRPPPAPSRPPGLTRALQDLVATEGLAALWRGNLATIIHRLPYSATNFAVFEATNKGLMPHMQSDVGRRLIAGAMSGLVACTVAYPLDLVRTRLSAQRGSAATSVASPLPPLPYHLPVRQGGRGGSSGSDRSDSQWQSSSSRSSSMTARPSSSDSSTSSSSERVPVSSHTHSSRSAAPSHSHITHTPPPLPHAHTPLYSSSLTRPSFPSHLLPSLPQPPLLHTHAHVISPHANTAPNNSPHANTAPNNSPRLHHRTYSQQPPLSYDQTHQQTNLNRHRHPQHIHQHPQHIHQQHPQHIHQHTNHHPLQCYQHQHQHHSTHSPASSMTPNRFPLPFPSPSSCNAPTHARAFFTASAPNAAATSSAHQAACTAGNPPHYRGIIHALSHTVQHEGVLGLYRGLGATLLQVTPSLALNFALYDSFKEGWLTHVAPLEFSGIHSSNAGNSSNRHSDRMSSSDDNSSSSNQSTYDSEERAQLQPPKMTTFSSLTCGAAAGFTTSTLTFPLDLIRRRVQVSHRAVNGPVSSATSEYLAMWRQVYLTNGLRGFYAGIVTEYAKVLPGMAIAFTAYEGFKELLKQTMPSAED